MPSRSGSRNSETYPARRTLQIEVEVESEGELERIALLIEQRTGFDVDVLRQKQRRIPQEAIDQAKALLKEGATYREAAKAVGYSQSALHRILPGIGISMSEAGRRGKRKQGELIRDEQGKIMGHTGVG